jgi:hypothetical protein
MLYVFLLVIVASLVLSVFSVNELLQAFDGLSSSSMAFLTLLGVALGVLIWRAGEKNDCECGVDRLWCSRPDFSCAFDRRRAWPDTGCGVLQSNV